MKSAFAGFAACLLAAPAAQAQISIEALAQQPATSSVSMSDDGTYLVGLIRPPEDENGDMALAVWDLTDPSAPPRATRSNDRMKFIAAFALKADKLFAIGRQEFTGTLAGCGEGNTTGATRTFVTKLYIAGTDMEDFEEPFTKGRTLGVGETTERCFELAGEAGLAQDLPLDPESVIAQRTDTLKLVSEYYRVNLVTGAEQLLYRETSSEQAVLFDNRTGDLLVKQSYTPAGNGDYELEVAIRDENGGFEVHDNLSSLASERHTVNIVGRDEESGDYYVSTDLFSDNTAIYFYDAEAKQFDDEALFAVQGYNVTDVILGDKPSNFNQLLGFTYAAGHSQAYYVDPQFAAIYDGLQQAYPDKDIDILEYTEDMSKILFEVSSSTQPPVYYMLYDQKVTAEIGAQRPWIDSEELRETELISYTARDGMQIPGFLTLPKGWTKDDGPLPTVVLPHGGPWARDTDNWDATGWTQFLASRGYAVLQPQYRGSDGWGRELWLAGDNQWGLKMQDDKDDGAAWLVSNGYADPEKIAIFGYSYGGFAAMAAVVRPGGPFRCAIAGAGVSNLERISNNWSDNKLQRAIQGRTVDGMDPMKNTDKASIPVLVYHGDRDVRVPLFHGEGFYNAVRGKVDAKFLKLADMPHSLPWYPEHHRASLAAIEDYLANDCGMPGADF